MGASSFGRRRYLFAYATLFIGVVFACLLFASKPIEVNAATGINEQINFQGRLYNSQGATVPDGIYNIQFKIYQDGDGQSAGDTTGSPAGSLKWTESHLVNNSQGITVKNGFLSVELGSVTAFGSSIDWNQDTLWLSMNVGSTNPTCTPFSSCTPDGEMIPMKRFTANAYALNAKYLGGLSSSQFVQLQSSTPGTQQTGNINVSGTVIAGTQLQTPAILAPGALSIQATGTNTLTINTTGAGTLNLATTNTTTVALGNTSATLTVEGSTISVGNGATNHTIQIGTSASGDNDISVGSSNSGSTLVLEGGTAASAIQIGNGATAHGVQIATNTTGDNDVSIGGANTSSSLTLEAGTSSTAIQIGNGATNHGIQIGSSSSGDNDLIIGSTNAGSTLLLQAGNSSTAVTIQTAASGNINIGTNAVTGKVLNVGSVGTTANDTTLHIADSTGNAVQSVFIGSNANASSVTTIQGGTTGGINLGTVGSATTGSTVHIADTSNGTGTQSVTIGSAGNVANSLLLQAGSTGKITLNGKTDINKSLATKKGTDYSTTGTSADVDFGDTSLVRLTGATTQTINSIANGRDGFRLTIVNASTGSLPAVISNETGSTAANRIRTGTGSDLTLLFDASISLVYDSADSRWRVEGSSSVNGSYIRQVPTTTADNTISPTANSVVGLTVKGTTGTAAHVIDIYNSNATPTLQGFFDSSGSLNVSQVIQPTSNNTVDLGLSGTAFRTVYAGTSTVTPLVDTAAGLSLGTGSATSVGIGRSGVTTTNNGALTVAQLLTGQLGATVSGATISLNENSNFATNINSGSSTGAVAIGNNGNAANTVNLDAGTGASAIQIGNSPSNHGIQIGSSSSGDNDILLGSANAGSTLNFEAGTAANAIQIGNSANAHGIQIGTGGAVQTIVIGSVNTTSATSIQGGATGSINIGTVGSAAQDSTTNIANTTNTAGTQTVNIGSNAKAANVVNVQAGTTGGINVGTVGSGTSGSTIHIADTSNGTNTQSVSLGSAANVANSLLLQAGSTGKITLNGKTDANNSLATKKGTDYSTTGTSADVDFGDTSLVRLTGATAQTIDSIANGRDGYRLTIVNASTGSLPATISNETGTTAANRIRTGTGSAITLPFDGSITLVYDSGASRWRVEGAVADATGYIKRVPASSAENTIAPTANSVVGLTVKGTTGTAAHVLDIYNSNATPTLQGFFDANGSLNVSQVIQPTANNTIDLGLSGTTFRTVYAGTSVVTPLVDTLVGLNLGTGSATSVGIGRTGITTTNNGALTVVQLLTGQLGATVTGAAVNLNASSNFATNINTGSSTGAVAIGNNGNAANTIDLDAGTGVAGIEIGNTNTAHGIQIGTNATGDNDIAIGGANAGSTLTLEAGTAAAAIQIGNGASDHGIQIGTNAGGANAVIIGSVNNGSTALIQGGNTSTAITLQTAAAGNINIGTNAVTGKVINIGSVGSTANATTVHIADTTANADQDVFIGGAGNTGSSVTIDAGTASTAIQIGNSGSNHGIQIGSNASGVNAILLGSANATSTFILESGTASNAIQIGNGATQHGVQIATNATGSSTVAVGSTNAGSTLNFEAGTAANAIQIGNSANAHGIQIGTGGAVQTIVIGSVNTTSATSIQGGATGSINIGTVGSAAQDSTTNIANTTNTAGTQTVNIGSNAKAANVVNVQAGTTGGINVGTVGSGTSGSTIHIADTSNGTGTQAVTLGSTANVANSLLLQAGSTGRLTLSGTSDVNNSIATKKGTDFSTTGTSADVDFGNTSLVRLTGATAQTIDSIANGRDGYRLTIVNASTGSLPATISNETGTTAANRIRTGTGSAITLPFDGSITLVYDSGASRWRVEGAVADATGYIKRVPASSAENTIAPTANSVVGLTVKGTTGTAAHVLDIYNSNATPTLQGFFDANGSLNVSQVIQPTANNTIDLGLSGTTFRTVYAGTSVVTPLVDTLVGLNLGTGSATSVGIGRTGITTTNNGALTVVQLLTGQLGATVTGAAVNLNASSNFATNINTGSSTGAVAIGNNGNAANTIDLDAGTGVAGIEIGNTNTAHGIQIGTNATGDNDIAIGGANAGSTLTLEAGTAAAAIQIGNGASDHGIQIGTNAGGANAVIIGSVNNGSTALIQGGNTSTAITLQTAAAGNINIGTNAVTGKVINIGSVGSTANATTVHIADTTANADQDVFIGGAGNTGSSVTIDAGTASTAIQIGNSGSNHGIQIGSNASGVNAILLGSANATSTFILESGTASNAIQIGNGATQHGVQIATNATGSSTVAVGSTNAGSTLNFEAGTAANAIQIGNSANAHGIQIGTGGAVQTIVIGSVNTTSATSIQGGATGSINIGTVGSAAQDSTTNIANTTNTAGTQTVNIGSNAKAANVVNVQAGTTGGINVGTVGSGTSGSTIHIADTSNGTGTQAVTLGSTANVANSLLLQAGSTGRLTLSGTSDVNNSIATKKGTDFSTTGTSADVDFGNTSLVRLTGATAQTIDSIANGRDGYRLTIVNASTGSLPATISNETGTTAANRIRTGTGSAITLPFDGSITLVYDSGASRWRVEGAASTTGGYIKQVPATSAENTIAPTANSVVGLTVKGTTGTAAHVLDIYNSNATPTLQGFFDANGSLNVSQVIQPTANNTIDLGLSGTTFRTVYAGTSVVTPLVDTLVGLNLGTGSATSVGIGRTGITTTNNGALTVVQLLTGQLGATVTGAAVNLNASSNFATNINTGSSTGAVAIGNNGNAANTIDLDAGTGVAGIEIGNTNTAHGIQIGTNATGDNDIAIGGTNTGSTVVIDAGTASNAIQIGNSANAHGIQIGTGAAVQTVAIGSTNTTSSTSIVGGTSGSVNIGSTGTSTLSSTTNIANTSNGTGTQAVSVGTSANTNNTFVLEAGTGASGIQIGNGATAHGIQIGSSNSADNDILIGGTNSGSTLILEGGTAAAGIAIGNGTTAHGIQIGTNATGDNDILIGGTNAGSTTTLQGGTSATVAISLQAAAGGGISIGTTNNNPIIVGGAGTSSQITLGQSSTASNTIAIGASAGNTFTQTINIGTSGTAGSTTNVTLGSTNAGTILLQGATQITNRTSGSADTLVVSNNTSSGTIALFKDNATTVFSIADSGLALFKPQTNATSAFMIQPSASSTSVFDVDTTNSRIGINVNTPNATLEVNSTVANTSGLRFTQLTSASTGGTSFTGILGLDTSGNVGLSQASVSLTSPALAYWDGQNDPTTGSQSYPQATVASRGTTTFVPTFGGAGNGVQLTQATNNETGTIDWSFSQVPFEEVQFQMKAGTGAADGTWFYSYADGVPTTEFGGGGTFTQGYIVYFGEYHHCIGIAYGVFTDGNQCNNGGGTSGGGTSPLKSALKYGINDNNWHDVDIILRQNSIEVRWDGEVVLTYTDVYTRDTSKLNFGFGARTGGSNNTHFIRNLLVTKLGSNTSQYNIDTVSPLAQGLNWVNATASPNVGNVGSLGIGESAPAYNLEVDGTFGVDTTVTSNVGTLCQGSATCATPANGANPAASAIVYGTGTNFLASMVGNKITFFDGTSDTIQSVTSTTQLTVSTSRSVANSGFYRISRSGSLVVDTSGNTNVGGNLTVAAQLDSTPHTFASTCGCLTNSAAGTFTPNANQDGAFSSAVFEGKLYVATKETDASSIYRYDGGTTWTQVSGTTEGRIINGSDTTIIDASTLTVYNGKLYAGSQTGSSLGALYSYDGTTWTQVSATRGTFGAQTTVDGISSMAVWNGHLYIFTQEPANGASVYRYDGNGTFTLIGNAVGKLASGDTADADAGTLISYDGNLWAGATTGSATGGRVEKYDGNVWTLMNSTAGTFGGVANMADVTSMAVYAGSLYAGLAGSAANTANIFMYKGGTDHPGTIGDDWYRTTSVSGKVDAGDATDVDSIPSMAVYNGRLYAGTATGTTTGAVFEYQSTDVASSTNQWLKVNTTRGTFGAQTTVTNVDSMTAYNGTLYVGTETSNIGSIYTFTKTSGNSYALKFNSDVTNGNYGSISFASNLQTTDNASVQGSFIFSNSIMSSTGAYDVAEDYPTRDDTLKPGDLVAVDPDETGFVRKAKGWNDIGLVGVYSEKPGLRLSQKDDTIDGARVIPVALAGRVKTNVTAENGPIYAGDAVTNSPTKPAFGMKSIKPGRIVGVAMQSYDPNNGQPDANATGSIMVFINPNNYTPVVTDVLTGTSTSMFQDINVSGNASVANLTVTGTLTAVNIYVNGHIVGNNDTRGEIVVYAGQTLATHTFNTAYGDVPTVVASPKDGFAQFRVDSDQDSFTIYLSSPASADIKFNYLIQQ